VRRLDRTRLATLALVAALASAGAFSIARAVGNDDAQPSAKVERMPAPLVKIANLDRVPTMKPLRSQPGGAPVPTSQTPQPTTGP
jgi:hypothetical protein